MPHSSQLGLQVFNHIARRIHISTTTFGEHNVVHQDADGHTVSDQRCRVRTVSKFAPKVIGVPRQNGAVGVKILGLGNVSVQRLSVQAITLISSKRVAQASARVAVRQFVVCLRPKKLAIVSAPLDVGFGESTAVRCCEHRLHVERIEHLGKMFHCAVPTAKPIGGTRIFGLNARPNRACWIYEHHVNTFRVADTATLIERRSLWFASVLVDCPEADPNGVPNTISRSPG